MAADIAAQRAWRRVALAPQANRAGVLMPHTLRVRGWGGTSSEVGAFGMDFDELVL